jgi:hypothetical protein
MRVRSFMAATAVAGSLFVTGAGSAAAAPDPVAHLQNLCQGHDGIFVPRPGWWQARCQGMGDVERTVRKVEKVCVTHLGGTLWYSIDQETGTANWICF